MSSLLARQSSRSFHAHDSRNTKRPREALNTLRPGWSSLASSSTSSRLSYGSRYSWVSLCPRVSRGSDGASYALLSSLSLFTNLALSSHQAWLSSTPLVPGRSLKAGLAWTACQSNRTFLTRLALDSSRSGWSILSRSAGDPSEAWRAGLSQSSSRPRETSVSSLPLNASEPKYPLDSVLSVSSRCPIFAGSSSHSLEPSGAGTASVTSFPCRSGLSWPPKISNPPIPAGVSSRPRLSLVADVPLRAHQSHLAWVTNSSLSSDQS